ncbi:MAG: hypothetical protein ACO1OB_26065 [Archangium sp.]
MSFVLLLALTAAPIPDGVSWVPRRSVHSSMNLDDTSSVESWRVECVELQVKDVLVTLGDFTFNQRDGRLFAPFFNSRFRRVPLRGSCMVDVPAAPRLPTREACVALGENTQTCKGGVCTRNYEPFLLGACEAELSEMKVLSWLALDVEHEDAVKTVKRLDALMKKGGKLWERGGCGLVAVKPGKRGVTVLRGPKWEKEGYLEPLFQQARIQGTREWTGDGLGMFGSSAETEPLLLGKDLIILGRRVLYLDEAVCAAEGKKL